MTSTILFLLATGSYLLSCTLGLIARLGLTSSGTVRWMHHAAFISTFALTALACSTIWWLTENAGWFLLPALIPLSAVPYVRARSVRHIYLALSAAPFYALSLVVLWR